MAEVAAVTPEARIKAVGGVGGVILSAAALTSVIKRMLEDAEGIGSAIATRPNLVLGVVVSAALIYSVFQIVDAVRTRSQFAQAAEAIASLDRGEVLIGREKEKGDLEDLVTKFPEVHLVGQEGIGKTGLLSALRAKLATSTRFRTLTISGWSGGFQAGPMGKLADEIWQTLTPEQRETLQVTTNMDRADLERVLGKFREVTGVRPLIILDQLEDHQMLHCDLLFREGQAVGRDELVLINGFWALIQALAEQGTIHVVMAHAAGTRIPKLTTDAAEMVVQRIPRSEVERYLDTTLKMHVLNPTRGWTHLCDKVIDDFSNNMGVMPRDLVFVCSALAQLPRLTASEYEVADRLPGLAARLIQREIKEIAEARGLDEALLTRGVRALGASEASLTVEELGQHAAGIDLAVLTDALGDLQQQGILRRRVHPSRCVTVWAPMHTFINAGIAKLGEPLNRWQRLLETRAAEHAKADWKSWWRSLIRPSLQVPLFFQSIRDEHFHYGPHRKFAAISTVRFIPYLLPPLLYLYLAAAERTWPVPFDEPVRDFMYVHGIELTKHVVVDEQIEKKASENRKALIQILMTKRKQDHWFLPAWEKDKTEENWIQAQAIAVLVNTPEFKDRRRELRNEVKALFDKVVLDQQKQPVGWYPNQQANYTQSEPALWAASAMAGLRGSITDAEISEYRQRLHIGHVCADKFGPQLPGFQGGWNMFPNQTPVTRHSTYSSALALSALLDTKKNDLPWNGSEKHRDELIVKTAGWLARTYDRRTKNWQPAFMDGKPQDGLTYQAYAAVLRAGNEAGFKVPDEIARDFPARIQHLVNATANDQQQQDYPGWKNMPITNHLNQPVKNEAPPFKYAWIPWAVDASTQWLRYTNKHANPSLGERAIVRRVRDHLVMDVLPAAVKRYDGNGEFTFWGAELLYGLDSIPPPRGAK